MRKTVLLLTSLFLSLWVGVAQNNRYTIGDNVSDFRLKNYNDKMISLSSYVNANGYVLVFTDNLSYGSQTSADMLNQLYQRLSILGYPVLVIAPASSSNIPYVDNYTYGYREQQQPDNRSLYKFPYLVDVNGDVYYQFGISYLPQIYIVERTGQGNVIRYISSVNNNTLNEVQDFVNSLIMRKSQYFNQHP